DTVRRNRHHVHHPPSQPDHTRQEPHPHHRRHLPAVSHDAAPRNPNRSIRLVSERVQTPPTVPQPGCQTFQRNPLVDPGGTRGHHLFSEGPLNRVQEDSGFHSYLARSGLVSSTVEYTPRPYSRRTLGSTAVPSTPAWMTHQRNCGAAAW